MNAIYSTDVRPSFIFEPGDPVGNWNQHAVGVPLEITHGAPAGGTPPNAAASPPE